METPVSAYLKVARGDYSFLLESVEGGERLARYSFIGTEPYRVVRTGENAAAGEQSGDPGMFGVALPGLLRKPCRQDRVVHARPVHRRHVRLPPVHEPAHAGMEEALGAFRDRTIEPILPKVVGTPEDHRVVLPGDPDYPA